MKIEIIISTDTLGDTNTAADNQRYAAAVRTAVQAEYPDAQLAVELTSRQDCCRIWVDDDLGGRIERELFEITSRIWDAAAY